MTLDMSYEGPERRTEALTEDRVRLMISEAVKQALTEHEQHLMTHMDQQFKALRQTFADAFPAGDPHGHRLAHERQIASQNWWDKAKSEAVSKVAAGGIWAVVIFLAVAAWEHLKNEARR